MSIVYNERDVSPDARRVIRLEGQPVKYIAFSTSLFFNIRLQQWDYVDVFEVHAHQISFYAYLKKYYQLNSKEKVIVSAGPNDVMTEIVTPEFYKDIAPDNVSFIVLVRRLKASRIKNVSVDMLESFLFSESQEPNTKVVTDSLPNIAIITELFSNPKINLNSVVHPVAEDYPVQERLKDGKDPNWYNVTFSPAFCSKVDCPVCFGPTETVNPKPQIVIIGLPLDHQLTIEANARYQERRKRIKRHLELMRLAVASINLSDSLFQALDASSDDSDNISDKEIGIV